MSKLDVAAIAKLFNQTPEYTDAMLKKHSVTQLPKYRQLNDGYDAFYSDMTSTTNDDPSLTKQEFTQECDPNYILDRFTRGLDINLTAQPRYGDFTNIPGSYHEAVQIVAVAKQSFMKLDARIRAKFDNDPGQFIDFVTNPENIEEIKKLGLAIDNPQQSTSANAPKEGETAPVKAE